MVMAGATKQENSFDITDDYYLFAKKTGMNLTREQLDELGLPPGDIGNMFFEKSTSMLLRFCSENPKYHIVSASRGCFENRYVSGRNIYKLADGDKNPHLVLDMCLKKDPHLLLEEMLEEALSINGSIDRGHKAK